MLKVNTRLSDEILARYGGFAYSIADGAQLLLLQVPAEAPAPVQTVVLTAQTIQNIENCTEQNTILNLNLNLGLAFLRRLLTAISPMGQVTRMVTEPQSPRLLPGQLMRRSMKPLAAAGALLSQRISAPGWEPPAHLTPPDAEPPHPAFFHRPVPPPVPAGASSVLMTAFNPNKRRGERVPPDRISNLHTRPFSPTSVAGGLGGDRIFRVEDAAPLTAAPPEQAVRRVPLSRNVPGPLSTVTLGQPTQPGSSASWQAPQSLTISPVFQTVLSPAVQPPIGGGFSELSSLKHLTSPAYLPALRTALYAPRGKLPLDGTDTDSHRPGKPPADSRKESRTGTSAGERLREGPHAAGLPALAQMTTAIPVFAPWAIPQRRWSPGPTEIKDAPIRMKQRLSIETPVEERRRAAPVISALWPMPGAPLPIQEITPSARSSLPPTQAEWPRVRTAGIMTAWTVPFPERAYPPEGHALFPPVTPKPTVSGHLPGPRAVSPTSASESPVWVGAVPVTGTGQLAKIPSMWPEPVLIPRSPAGPARWPGASASPAPQPGAAFRIEGTYTAQRTAPQVPPVGFGPAPILLRADSSVSQPQEQSGEQADIPTVRTRRIATQKTEQTAVNRAINAPGASPPASAGQDLSRAVEEAVKNLDIKKLTERVYRDLETRLRSEQARRGKWMYGG